MVEHFARLLRNAVFRRKWREDRDLAERTLSKRRQRYANDPEYRERIKDSVRKNREAKKGGDSQKRSFNRDKAVIINCEVVHLFSAGKTASIVGAGSRTIETWEKKGLIPINRARDSVGRRWYPAAFVAFLAEHVANRKEHRCDEWSRRVKDAWQMRQLGNHPIPVVSEHLEDDHGE